MGRSSIALLGFVALTLAVQGCSSEKRTVAPALPHVRPSSPDDPRAAHFEANAYQLSQGARYFTYYCCGGCHQRATQGVPDLADGRWIHGGGFSDVYASIADGRGSTSHAFGAVIPGEQIWQLTAYVRSLPTTDPAKIRRQNLDMAAEPHAAR